MWDFDSHLNYFQQIFLIYSVKSFSRFLIYEYHIIKKSIVTTNVDRNNSHSLFIYAFRKYLIMISNFNMVFKKVIIYLFYFVNYIYIYIYIYIHTYIHTCVCVCVSYYVINTIKCIEMKCRTIYVSSPISLSFWNYLFMTCY